MREGEKWIHEVLEKFKEMPEVTMIYPARYIRILITVNSIGVWKCGLRDQTSGIRRRSSYSNANIRMGFYNMCG